MNIDEQTENICRTCLCRTEDLRSIFKVGQVCGETTTLSDMLIQCFALKPTQDDGLPQRICMKCLLDLSRSYLFRQTCIKSDAILREQLQNKIINHNTEYENENDEYLYFYGDDDDVDEVIDENNENNIEQYEIEQKYNNNGPSTTNITTCMQKQKYDESKFIPQNSIDSQISYDNMETTLATSSQEMLNEREIDNDGDKEQMHLEHVEFCTINEIINDNKKKLTNDTEENYDNNLSTAIMNVKSEVIAGDISSEAEEREPDEILSSTIVSGNYHAEERNVVIRKRRKRKSRLPGPPFTCEICGKILSNHSSYKYHKQLHSDVTPFLCSHCGEGFKTRNAYEGHMTTHNQNNPHTCEICGKSYRQAGSLRCHMLRHSGEKPFLCVICGKGMTQKSGIKKHMLTHTGEKPYSCDICEKKFRYSSNLITHKRGHSGRKPYACAVCDKSFVGGEQLKRHAIIHTTDKPFECLHCGKKLNRHSSLLVHRNLKQQIKNC